ncbi:SMI1/KNR4 family protein [Paraflavitalea speifideaquila]|uniref:SMI1/KNR4 family protein n=1 Tax=Paraflavitalea speifideaquila TaxID=3076558 RepID=UPI0028F16F9A|nr:SMI1/KNR4 family protein [Paraflavitalea speifideiaquila]
MRSIPNSRIPNCTAHILKNHKIGRLYTHWIPIFCDHSGNFAGIDLDPDTKGIKGQVINFGRDESLKFQIAPNLTAFLVFIRKRIESGKCDKAIVLEDEDEKNL